MYFEVSREMLLKAFKVIYGVAERSTSNQSLGDSNLLITVSKSELFLVGVNRGLEISYKLPFHGAKIPLPIIVWDNGIQFFLSSDFKKVEVKEITVQREVDALMIETEALEYCREHSSNLSMAEIKKLKEKVTDVSIKDFGLAK